MTDQEKLQVIYDGFANDESPRALFIGIADYVQLIDQSGTLSSIVKRKVISERDKHLAELNKLGDALVEESKKTVDSLKVIIANHDIKNDDVEKELDDYRRVLLKEIQYSTTFPEAVSHSVDMIIRALKEAGFTELVKGYVRLDEHDNITSWTFADSYRPYMDLLKRLKEQHKVTVWGDWDELCRVYEVIIKRDEILAELDKNNDHMNAMNFYGLVHEMREILDEKPDIRPIYFKEKDFRYHISHFHAFMRIQMPEPRIRSLAEPSVKSKLKETFLPNSTVSLDEVALAIADLSKRLEEFAQPQSDTKELDKADEIRELTVTSDGGFKYDSRLLKGLSTDTQIGKLLALLIANPLSLVTYETIEIEAGSEDPRGAGFIKRNLQEALKKNNLKLELETRRNKGYVFIGVSEISNST